MAQNSQLLEEFIDGNRQFSSEVYTKLLKKNSGNFMVCPLSVQVVLALLQSGAKGSTAKQLSAGLRLPESFEKIQQTFAELIPKLQGNEKYDLKSANKIYLKNGLNISDQYKKTAVNVFDAEIQNIDFANSQNAASEMNKWIEEKTENKIKDMVPSSSLNNGTLVILVNAMYFHGKWVDQFPFYKSGRGPFFLDHQTKVDAEMMKNMAKFNYYENDELDAKFLEMPYQGDDISMTIVLPNDKEGLPALEARIADALSKPQYEVELVSLEMPKFKMDTNIVFKPILIELGIIDTFGPSADFSGIGENQEPLFVSDVLQKTYVHVHEKGTTAAAVTTVRCCGACPGPKKYKTFIADHPFIFYIKSEGGIMFVGRYVAP